MVPDHWSDKLKEALAKYLEPRYELEKEDNRKRQSQFYDKHRDKILESRQKKRIEAKMSGQSKRSRDSDISIVSSSEKRSTRLSSAAELVYSGLIAKVSSYHELNSPVTQFGHTLEKWLTDQADEDTISEILAYLNVQNELELTHARERMDSIKTMKSKLTIRLAIGHALTSLNDLSYDDLEKELKVVEFYQLAIEQAMEKVSPKSRVRELTLEFFVGRSKQARTDATDTSVFTPAQNVNPFNGF